MKYKIMTEKMLKFVKIGKQTPNKRKAEKLLKQIFCNYFNIKYLFQ